MNVTREDVMVYSAMLGGFFALAAGFLGDIGYKGTSFACVSIAIVSLITLGIAYLHTKRS